MDLPVDVGARRARRRPRAGRCEGRGASSRRRPATMLSPRPGHARLVDPLHRTAHGRRPLRLGEQILQIAADPATADQFEVVVPRTRSRSRSPSRRRRQGRRAHGVGDMPPRRVQFHFPPTRAVESTRSATTACTARRDREEHAERLKAALAVPVQGLTSDWPTA